MCRFDTGKSYPGLPERFEPNIGRAPRYGSVSLFDDVVKYLI